MKPYHNHAILSFIFLILAQWETTGREWRMVNCNSNSFAWIYLEERTRSRRGGTQLKIAIEKQNEAKPSRVEYASLFLSLALRTVRTAALLSRANERARMCPGIGLGRDGSAWSLCRPGLRRRQMKCQKCEAKLHKPLDGWKINSSAVKRWGWGGDWGREGQRALRQVNRKKEKLTSFFFFNATLSSLTSAEKRCQVPSDSQTVAAPRAPTYPGGGVLRGAGQGMQGLPCSCCHIYPKQW